MFDQIVGLYEDFKKGAHDLTQEIYSNLKKTGEDFYNAGVRFYDELRTPPMQEWAYDVENWTQDDWNRYYALMALPGASDYLTMLYDMREDEEYLRNHDMDRSDVHNPTKLRSSGSISRVVATGMNFVSHNLAKLYR